MAMTEKELQKYGNNKQEGHGEGLPYMVFDEDGTLIYASEELKKIQEDYRERGIDPPDPLRINVCRNVPRGTIIKGKLDAKRVMRLYGECSDGQNRL